MNTGQTLLTVGAMYLLSVLVLQANKNFMFTEDVMMDSKFGVLATSLGTSLIEEASSKAFDAATDTNAISTTAPLTAPSGLGPMSGEAYPNFNDFDDFNNYVRTDTTMPSAPFKLECSVMYINPSNPEAKVNYKTWHKKIIVKVTSEFMSDTVTLSSIYSYWFFR